MVSGIFHDAHEVYAGASPTDDRTWIATFATKALADAYVEQSIREGSSLSYKVVPV